MTILDSLARSALRTLVLLAPTLLAPAVAAAQSEPPEPLPLEEISFPDFEERTLSNGAELIVVRQDEQPFVTVNLVFRGGSSADPVDRVGVAEMVAGLLDKGTTSRTAEEIADQVDFLGANLGASAGADFSTVTLATVTPNLDEGLELLADVVMNPVFPDEELALLREQTLTALQLQLSQAGALASRSFMQAVYGRHPYGKLQTPETVEAIDTAAVHRFHRSYYRPNNAIFVVAGDIEAERAAERIEAAFRGWAPGAVSPPTYFEPPTRTAREIILVHKPGSVQSAVRVGHTLPEGQHTDWTPLTVANQVLGGGSSGRLFEILREDKGWTYGAYSSTSRRRDAGYFQAQMDVRNEVTDSAVAELLHQLERMRTEIVPPNELQEIQSDIVGSFPLQIETPQQIASQVTNYRLLGLSQEDLESFRSRVAALDGQAVRDAAAAHLHPDRAVIVVVGDANEIRASLAPFGPLTLKDVEGNVISVDDIAVRTSDVVLDASALEPAIYTYQITFQGQPVGEMTRTVARRQVEGTDAVTLRSEMGTPGQQVTQEVTFAAPSFRPMSASTTIAAQGQTFGGEIEVVDGVVRGTSRPPGGEEQSFEKELPAGAVIGEMQEVAFWVADLEEGEEITLPVVGQNGSVSNVTIEVKGRSEVTVPAGTFEAVELELRGGQATQRVYARAEAPHIPLKIETAGQPVVLELKEIS